jgi:hypothetical protein
MVEGLMVSGGTVLPGARKLVEQGLAEEIKAPKPRPVEESAPVAPALDFRTDAQKAVDICHYAGLPLATAPLVERVIAAERKAALVEEYAFSMSAALHERATKIEARLAALEEQNKKGKKQ